MENLIKVNFKEQRIKKEEMQREKFKQQWIDLLTEDKIERILECFKILENSKSEMLGIMKYRRLLMQEGRGQDITADQLNLANCYGEEYLKNHLEEMFLEPISLFKIEYFYKVAKEKKILIEEALERVHSRHKEYTGLRFMSIVLTL